VVGVGWVGEWDIGWGSGDSGCVEPFISFGRVYGDGLTGTCMRPYRVVRLCLSPVLAVHYRQRCPDVLLSMKERNAREDKRVEGREEKTKERKRKKAHLSTSFLNSTVALTNSAALSS
jgi:hypothetical protein